MFLNFLNFKFELSSFWIFKFSNFRTLNVRIYLNFCIFRFVDLQIFESPNFRLIVFFQISLSNIPIFQLSNFPKISNFPTSLSKFSNFYTSKLSYTFGRWNKQFDIKAGWFNDFSIFQFDATGAGTLPRPNTVIAS